MTALSPHTEKPEPRDTIKVLHIDDEPDIIDITIHSLGGFDPGIHVHPCTDPGNALKELEADHFDCVVSDYQMGDYDSIGLAKTIQERFDLPILMYTGRGSEEVAEAAFAAGFDDYIRKEASPSHFQVLGKRIRAAVDKHRAERERRKSEERYRTLIENTLGGVWIIDAEANTSYVNPSMAEMMGYGQEEMRGQRIFSFMDEQWAEFANRSLNRRKKGIKEIFEFEFLRKDGKRLITLLSTSPITDSEGNYQGAFAFLSNITERRRVEEALRVNRERLNSFMESAPVSLTIYDADLNYVEANQNFLDLYGYTRENLFGRNMVDAHPDAVETGRVKQYREVIRTGEPRFLPEVRSPKKLGDRVFSISAFKVGEGLGLVSLNITESKKLEQRLRESEALYRELAEKSIDVIYKVDPEGRLQYISPSVEALTGYRKEELIGEPFLKFLSANQRTGVEAAIGEAIAGDQTQGFQTEIIGKGGRRVSVEVNSSMIKEHGEYAGFQGVIRDVTERRRIEDELRESEERYRNLVELSPDAIITFDFSGFVTSVNTAIERLTGFSKEELVGKHFTKLGYFRLQDIPRCIGRFNSIIMGNLPPPVEFSYRRKDGTMRWAEGHVGYVYEKWKRVGFQSVVMDITDRKIVEEELKEHASSLEELVEKRSQELVEAEKMVTAGKIASMVGHDLRGPLVNIKNSLYLIERNPEYFTKLKEKIDGSVDYALDMLEELRFSTRTEAPQIIFTDLMRLISRALEDVQVPPTITVETKVDEGVERVILDPTQIRRVLDNLIRNAVEAMPQGGELGITAGLRDDDLVMVIGDTGSGIPADLMPDLFRAFTTTKPKGIGLGLTYCKRALEAHGGSISVESEEGRGTRFTISIPQSQPMIE